MASIISRPRSCRPKCGSDSNTQRLYPNGKKDTRPLESEFKSKVIKKLKKIPGVWFVVYEAGSVRGIPDIIGCYHGHIFAWEVKRDSKESTTKGRAALQAYTLQKVREAGGIASFVHPDNFKDCLRELLSLKDFPFN